MRRGFGPAVSNRILRFGGVSFSPADVPGLALWLDANESATTYQASGGARAAADGDVLGYWMDKSGNAKHASQDTTSKKPTRRLVTANNKTFWAARFDGVDDAILSAVTVSQPSTIFAVAKVTSGAGDVFDGQSASNRHLLRPGSNIIHAGASLTTAAAGTIYAVHAAVFNGAASKHRLNNASLVTGNAGTQDMTAGMCIGAGLSGAQEFLNGEVVSVLVYSGEKDEATQTAIAGYLASIVGISL